MPSSHPHPTGLLVTCPVDLCCPEAGFTAAEKLRVKGHTVTVPAQGCCGRTMLERGDRQGAAILARGMINAFAGCASIAVPHRACAAMVRDHYPALLSVDPVWADRARHMAARCHDLADLLAPHAEPCPDRPGLQVTRTRDRTLRHLDQHLRSVEAQLTESGGRVHWASDGPDAVSLIRQLCLDHGIGPAMLDHSPLLIEIGLEEALARDGMTGSGMMSVPLIGISGALFLVAETGSAVILPSDGKAHLLLARCQIVVAAIDQIAATLSDAGQILQVLPQGSDGPSRVLFATGPRATDEADGPDHFHLVLLDNGRTDLLDASMAALPGLAQRAGWIWRTLSRFPVLYRRATSMLCRLQRRGGSFQARWRDAGHG
ncbi:hypothetical protein CHU95_16650 [Niveispirillum lacus]|uniref:LUD domain-containing protein n=1 Tax=Niveispirillum lacus TaxID=1981099 RepID=A0A255YVH9_9PROT|nr:LUD domain-containing protein [Niveispirillum lacus]OYQ32430.1 hypothetical protein CHU95_16650 [Niveispirillum lacus]